ncbi:hypothetical protein ACIPVK_03240 [Paeniglutamicibacter sp. MACA_103]|uniref:hypothetical protein n=1 Tax=Paeniglutamicibacter sp. MACA_103 TaxID=3377337 RepID=UPI003894E59A
MSTPSISLTRGRGGSISRFGAIGLAGAVASALSAIVLLAYPPQVAPEMFSYPFDAAGFTAVQVFFALQHAALVLLLIALLRSSAVGTSRLARWGTWISILGMGLVGIVELVAITAAHAVVGDSLYNLVSGLYAIPSLMLGVGMVLAGAGVLREKGWRGPARFLPLLAGVWVFAVLLPALAGTNMMGRIAIFLWMVIFAALGWVLWRGNEHGELRN